MYPSTAFILKQGIRLFYNCYAFVFLIITVHQNNFQSNVAVHSESQCSVAYFFKIIHICILKTLIEDFEFKHNSALLRHAVRRSDLIFAGNCILIKSTRFENKTMKKKRKLYKNLELRKKYQ